MDSNLKLVRDSVASTQQLALGTPKQQGKTEEGEPKLTYTSASDQAKEKAVQSVAQSAAIAVQNAVEMVRNVSTMEVVAIGVATAEWIAQPENVFYEQIIQNSMDQIEKAQQLMGEIASTAAGMISDFGGSE